MLLRIICLSLASAITAGAAEPLGPPPDASPVAVCPQPTYNWGTVFTGQEVVHRYPIRNEGAADLLLTKVTSTCRCTKKDYTDVIPPGAEGHVTLAIDTTGFRGATEKRATVKTNDPRTPSIVLRFGGTARELVKISPLFPVLKGLVGGEPAKAVVTIEQACEIPVKGLKVSSESSRLKVSVKEIKKDSAYEVHLETLPGVDVANVQETVSLEAMANDVKVGITLKANISLRRRVEVQPQWVIFRYGETERWEQDRADPPVRRLAVTAAEGVTFSIEKMEAEGGFFEAELVEKEPRKSYEIVVKIRQRPDGPAQPARGRLRIETSDPFDKVLDLRIMAFFKKPPE